MSKLAVLLLSFVLISICWGEEPVITFKDVPVDLHVHTGKNMAGFSDGWKSPTEVMVGSKCPVVWFTDHLDGIISKGTDNYLGTIRALSGTAKTLAIPGVEVTCGNAYSSHDVLALGLTNEALNELARQYKLGAFEDPESGLPCLRQIADQYHLVLIACHPDSAEIPFNLGDGAKYMDGFENFDSAHIGFEPKKFDEHCMAFYALQRPAIATGSSDYHFLLSGALPTRSVDEIPITHVFVEDGQAVTEQSVTEAMRQGHVYATSLLNAGIVQGCPLPGQTWDVYKDKFLTYVCKGVSPSNMIYRSINVISSNGVTSQKQSFEPVFKDDLMILRISFDQLNMPNCRWLSIDFGGRILTSTIFVDAKSIRVSNRISDTAPSVVQPTPASAPAPVVQPPLTAEPTLEQFKYKIGGCNAAGFGGGTDGDYWHYPSYRVGINDDGQGYVWIMITRTSPVICKPFRLGPPTGGKFNAREACVSLADIPWRYTMPGRIYPPGIGFSENSRVQIAVTIADGWVSYADVNIYVDSYNSGNVDKKDARFWFLPSIMN